jgi:Domain of unknown function (DUF4167)
MNRRPMHNNRNNNSNGNNNNRFRRNQHQRGRGNGQRMDHEQESDMVSPQQRRHAANQQAKYMDMARNARQSGDRVETEFYLQHVEHYTRVIAMADAQFKEREESRGGRSSGHREEGYDGAEEQASGYGIATDEEGTISQPQRRHQREAGEGEIRPRRERYGQRDGAERGERADSQQRTYNARPAEEQGEQQDGDRARQHRKLRPFRQQRLPMQERQEEGVALSAAPVEKPNRQQELVASIASQLAGTPYMASETTESSPAVARRGRGRPKKADLAQDSIGNSGSLLAGVLPKPRMDDE